MLSSITEATDSLMETVGISLIDEEVDLVIFRTNEFLTSGGASQGGPFWYIMQMCMCLGAVFAVIMAAGMAYKMMVKGEPFDPLKILRAFGVACVMILWYPQGGVLDCLAIIPNAIGSWTHDMYVLEANQVSNTLKNLKEPLDKLEAARNRILPEYEASQAAIDNKQLGQEAGQNVSPEKEHEVAKDVHKLTLTGGVAGGIILLDKLVMWFSLIIFKVGWWGTIYCQQIILGMLTIFGPIQWAFSLLPKWEGAWAKWITRYLTVHFYGAMLYFVGFYVLLLYDIVFSIQLEMLSSIVADEISEKAYFFKAIMTTGYLLVASMVSLKCLNLVPDLAAWMIPEGDTAYSTRNFGEGVASEVKRTSTSSMGSVMKSI
jgi:hypothetical protein